MLGVTSECLQIDSRQLNCDALIKLTASAQNQISILSRHFDSTVFNNEDFVQAASQLVRRTRYTNIKILVHDTEPMVKSGHRVLELSQRISSKIEIRTICHDYAQFNQSFLVADGAGYIHNLQSDLYNAEVNFNDAEKSNELLETFKNIWELSAQDAVIRRLCI